MVELSLERIDQILHKETVKKEELDTILRSIYTRYMYLYENYFADVDALNDEKVAELRKYHEETKSLIKYYYMDIPLDICAAVREYEKKYISYMLRPDWQKHLLKDIKKFENDHEDENDEDEGSEPLKVRYAKQSLSEFYDVMDYVFRDGFGTSSKEAASAMSGIAELIFGKEEK